MLDVSEVPPGRGNNGSLNLLEPHGAGIDALVAPKESGTGLGLPIANRIVTNHGGTESSSR